MLPREFGRRLHCAAERMEAESDGKWSRTLMIVNHIRPFLKKRPISLDELKTKANMSSDAPSKEEYLKDLERIQRRQKPARA